MTSAGTKVILASGRCEEAGLLLISPKQSHAARENDAETPQPAEE